MWAESLQLMNPSTPVPTKKRKFEVTMFLSRNPRDREQGQSFVELSLTLPIILLLFFGMIEIVFAAHSYMVVANAAREGVRFGGRGVHVPLSDITSIVETGLSKSLSVEFSGSEANTTIIVTQIDINEDSTYVVYDRNIYGDMAATSAICEPQDSPCPEGALEVQEFIDANTSFNASPGLCQASDGCNGDFVVVEVFHSQETAILSGFVREFIPTPFSINSRAVMRVLQLRASS
jgi:hypothetical protein